MRRKYVALFAALATALALAVPAGANVDLPEPVQPTVIEGQYDSYIVLMREDPLVVTEGKDNLNSPKAKAKGKALAEGQDKVLADVGIKQADKVNTYVNAINGFSALVSYEEALQLAAHKDVAAVYPDELRKPTTNVSPDFLGLTDAGGPWASGYDGEGVVIGVIDSGIWPEHPSFADDGSYSDPGLSLEDTAANPSCEFGNTAHNPDDAPFECNNKLIGARQVMPTYRALIGAAPDEFDSARDDDGHGTHTASTAGGNSGVEASVLGEFRGVVSGIAPRAHIVAYKGLGNLGGFGSDLAAAVDQAVADGVDVINYSIGSSSFAIGPDDVAFMFAADAGVFVATSNGNSGPGPATTGSPSSVPWLTSVGASTHTRTFEGSALLGNGAEYFGASITQGTAELPLIDAADAGDELCAAGSLDPALVSGNIVLCLRGVYDRVEKSRAVEIAGGAGMILYNATDTQSQVTDTHWVPSVHINNTDGLAVKEYISSTEEPTAQIIGGEATPWQPSVMADFSSRGPNRLAADIIKPDVTAPGVNILAGNSPFPDPGSVHGELFQSISGTSMSSPHVAGVFALLKQAHPDWSAAAAKSAIMTTARQDVFKEDGSTPADPFDMGAGHIVPGGDVSQRGTLFNPGVVYDAGLFEYAAFSCGAELGIFTTGTCAFLEGEGIPMEPYNLNVPSIGVGAITGSITVERTLTNVAGKTLTLRPSVEAPEGYEVSVSPQTLVVQKNKSATYSVTITNQSAPVDVWRFGSLTWSELSDSSNKSGYSARSPIAVAAAALVTPELLSESGVSGSGSFEVTFGYTGDYEAAGHGLEAATVINDNVVQDPDQNFDPNDGFSDAHQFTTNGSAYLRLSIPPEGVDDPNTDLDIFLYNPAGQQVASSTNGGTNETVEVFLPADGTWTLYVHGWQTAPGDNADYTLYAWDISATPGGSLAVDSAPSSATIGETATVQYSWDGAADGQLHLGAVSHTGPDGLIALTLIEVDNR